MLMAENMSVEYPPVTNQPLHRFKASTYKALWEKGHFRRGRVELLFGLVVEMSPTDPKHEESARQLDKILHAALGDRASVSCQMSFTATEDSIPQPDIYVAPPGDYWSERPSHAYLVIEVSNTSLAYDREEKSLVYGTAKVDEYWIVDVVHDLVEVRRDPEAGAWRTITTHRRGEKIRMLAFPDVEVEVAHILPPPRQ